LGISAVQAKSFKPVAIKALEDFNNLSPSQTYSFQFLESIYFNDSSYIQAGTVVNGNIIKVFMPQRGKRDGYFEMVPVTMTHDDKTETVETPQYMYEIRAYSPRDNAHVAAGVAKGAAGYLYKGVANCTYFTEGFCQSDNGYRIKAGFKRVYDNSFVSNMKFGQELNIKKDDTLILKLKKISY
jgi:hypothetical protein